MLKDYKERNNYNQEYNGLSTMGMLGWGTHQPRLINRSFRAARPPTL